MTYLSLPVEQRRGPSKRRNSPHVLPGCLLASLAGVDTPSSPMAQCREGAPASRQASGPEAKPRGCVREGDPSEAQPSGPEAKPRGAALGSVPFAGLGPS